MDSFHSLLESCAAEHGHLCPGQVVGVRMAILGCRLIGMDQPKRLDQIKKLLVYVEMDRCTADAVAHVTGVKLGRRSLKFVDYGIMAATFMNLDTGDSYRVLSTEEARDLARVYAPEFATTSERQISAYKRMPESVLFRVQEVRVKIDEFDLPGPTRRKVACSRCGQLIRDAREIFLQGKPVCKPCTDRSYFTHARDITWPDMGWSPCSHHNDHSSTQSLPEPVGSSMHTK